MLVLDVGVQVDSQSDKSSVFFGGIGGFTGGNNEDSGHFQVLGND